MMIILNAYESLEEVPFMVFLGYLASSVFIYHHCDIEPSANSPLTTLLAQLWTLLSDTDLNEL